tara:strand:- start:957 stop:2093 length:1137 start_codon:yes stop_codon:yes gene_type:complete
VKHILARLVLLFGVLVYVFPYFIVKEWGNYNVELYHLLVPYFFFMSSTLLLWILNPFLESSRVNLYLSSKTSGTIGMSRLPIVGVIVLFVFWGGYFLVFPDHSAFYTYWSDPTASESPRFAFYESNAVVQLLYALTGRILIPLLLVILVLRTNQLTVVISLVLFAYILLHSGERQNLILLSMAFLVVAMYKHGLDLKKYALAAIIPISGLVQAFLLQGNYSDQSVSLYVASIRILFNRVIVDPFFMHSYLNASYDGPLLYGATNRVVGYLLGSYELGWSAIGLLPDLFVNFGDVGYFLGVPYFCFLVFMACKILNFASTQIFYVTALVLFLVALVSLYYANIFSIVPIAVYGFASLLCVRFTFRRKQSQVFRDEPQNV